MKKSVLLCLLTVFLLSFVLGVSSAEEPSEMEILDQADFASMDVGSVSDTDFAAEWSYLHPAGDAPAVCEEGENRFLRLNGYSQIISPYVMYDGEAYLFQIKIRLTSSFERVGFFVRAAEPALRENPFHSEYSASNPIKMHIHFFESDWYLDAMKKGASYMGGSGIGIFPGENSVKIAIKTYIPDALKMGVAYHEFTYPAGMDPKTFLQYTVKDNGNDQVEIYLGDTMLAALRFSDSDLYEDDSEDLSEYYQTVVMTDENGSVLELFDSEDRKLEAVDNARIASSMFYTAVACRASTVDIDDLLISVPKKTAAETPGAQTPEAAQTQSPGEQPGKTAEAKTAAAGHTPPRGTNTAEEGGTSLPLVIGITVGGVVIVAAVIWYLIAMKKKHEK